MEGVVVLGGGIAGISAAYHANQAGQKIVVYEAADRWGGLLDNFTIDGFRFDKAVHFSFTQDKYVRSIFDQTDFDGLAPLAYNYDRGRWLKHPVQNNLFPLPVQEKLEAIISFMQRPELRSAQNLREWLLQQYGKVIAERFPVRYTKKYWTVPAEELSICGISDRMYRPNLAEVLLGAMTAETPNTYLATALRYPRKGGFRTFLEPMLNGIDMVTGKSAVYINPRQKYVEFADGKQLYFQYLLSSIPLPELVSMIDYVPSAVKQAAASLWATSVALVSVGFNRPDVAKFLWFYIYDEAILPSRAYSPNLKSPDNVPAGCSSLQFEIYFSKHRPLAVNPDNLVEHVVDCLEKLQLASGKDILLTDCRIIPFGNIVIDHGMSERRELVKAYLKSIDIVPIGRFGEWEYLWSDQSLLSGKRAVENLLEATHG